MIYTLKRVFKNRMLRRIFWVMTEGEIGEWRKLQHKKLNDLFSSLTILRVIIVNKNGTRSAGSAYGGEKRCLQGFGWAT